MTYTTDVTQRETICGLCVHWQPVEGIGLAKDEWFGRGECHRYPPTLVGKQQTDKVLGWSDFQGAWPTTLESDFCGEFVAMEEEEEEMSEEVVSAWRATGERLKKLIVEK